MQFIENDKLKLGIHSKGAELQSVFHKQYGVEYMWEGNPAFWARRSPVLFPIVGALKEGTYYFEEVAYRLPKHGFARDMMFHVEEQSSDRILFSIESSPQTLLTFPFRFKLFINYLVTENMLHVTYRVKNEDKKAIYFSIGGHPAFKIPLAEGTMYDDYALYFDKEETLYRWPVSKEGLIEADPQLLRNSPGRLPLSKALFEHDALVLKNLQSGSIALRSDKTAHGLLFDFASFPYLGLWAAPGADFLCIEPWCGIADSVQTNQQLIEKEGINTLQPATVFEKTWTVSFF